MDITYFTGWIVLSGKTRVKDPHMNFRHSFAGSSKSGHDVGTPTILQYFRP
jgi:L-type amino acid transporter 9